MRREVVFLLAASPFLSVRSGLAVPNINFDATASAEENLFLIYRQKLFPRRLFILLHRVPNHFLLRSQIHNLANVYTYSPVSLCARLPVKLIPCQIRIMTTTDEIIRDRIRQIWLFQWGHSVAGGRRHESHKLVQIVGRAGG